MTDFCWVQYRHIPVEIQAAFDQELAQKYDIVDSIDPLPAFVAPCDDYLMLALNLPDDNIFHIDDVIPFRIGGKDFKIHTAHKRRPWCFKCQQYGHAVAEVGCAFHPARRAKATGRLLRDPFCASHWRTVDPGHEGWVYIDETNSEGRARGWEWEKKEDCDFNSKPPDHWVPPYSVEVHLVAKIDHRSGEEKVPEPKPESFLKETEKEECWKEIVREMSLRLQMEPEVEGGAIALAGWMKDKSEDMLAIIWELEEGADPWLDVRIDGEGQMASWIN
ncbi:hypothetical protein CBR_g34221 [Chara braunii]|uniref:Uncharacterized protein n=1 Tax=Chara braunii TaxID=69332 RepID=A0A388LI95_CHABU|nr:hypothetical protein CBR_g34221 [Chara braunii]|eukprot:GBG82039.1 hypothetical protein CBR_g34221 [Chara braunii]